MPRVKRGVSHVKRRKNILADVKGYKWGRKNLIKLAKTARTLAGAHAYKDRRNKKRDRRSLWQIKIGAFVREHGLSYSKFTGALKAQQIELNRKVLSELAVHNKPVMAKIVDRVKK